MGQNFPKLLLPLRELEIFNLFPVSLKGGDKAAHTNSANKLRPLPFETFRLIRVVANGRPRFNGMNLGVAQALP